MKTHRLLSFALRLIPLAGAFALTSFAGAQTIVNGSFDESSGAKIAPETGYLQAAPYGWSWDNSSFYWIADGGLDGIRSDDGGVFVGLQRGSTTQLLDAVLRQSLTGLAAGESYEVSFLVRARNAVSEGGTWTVSVSDSDAILGSLSDNPIAGSWAEYSFVFIATDENPVLRLSFTNNLGGDYMVLFDNLTVTQVVPEPAAMAAFAGAGVLLVAFVLRRRRNT
ncbi:PEP-CTERM putative exosortase interaction domain-containing protein [Opitutaceae bacterium TAV1]|nr:glycosyltransferase family 1 [Opitutaceae bacterium TAV5]EIP97827.1 PEP-CTERM putative exosortase interaction domain-containing protein [Opitutaceae bacterium TAV1]